MPSKDTVRIAALGDLHYGRTTPPGSLQPLFAQINDSADILALCGDLTDYGLVEEARGFVKELIPAVKIPIVAVLGNHDVESGQQAEIVKILVDAGVVDARRRDDRDPRDRVRRDQGLRRRLRPPRARAVGRGHHQDASCTRRSTRR